jgi:hypothetical protein
MMYGLAAADMGKRAALIFERKRALDERAKIVNSTQKILLKREEDLEVRMEIVNTTQVLGEGIILSDMMDLKNDIIDLNNDKNDLEKDKDNLERDRDDLDDLKQHTTNLIVKDLMKNSEDQKSTEDSDNFLYYLMGTLNGLFYPAPMVPTEIEKINLNEKPL